MKKHSLFKFMGILLLLLVVITYLIPSRGGEVSYLPLGDVVTNYLQSYYYFFDTVIFLFMIGAFYGVLNKNGAYKKLLDKIVVKVKPISNNFVFIVTIIFALLTSLTGITLPLLVFVPFVITLILLLGYDKLVAITSTVVSMLVGFVGGIFVSFRDPSNYYGYSATTFDNFVGVTGNTSLIVRIVLLLLGVALLIVFINRHIKDVKNKKVKYDLNGNSELLVTEVKGNYKDIKDWPLIVIFALLLVLVILGLVPWNDIFSLEIFSNFHTKVSKLAIKDFAIFGNIISSTFPEFGAWSELGTFMMTMVVMLLALIVIKFVYKIKLDDLISDMVSGAMKMLPAAALMMLAYTVLICTYNNGFIETLISEASGSGDINFVIASLITMLGSMLHVDLYYTAAGVFTPILSAVSDEALFNVFSVAFQSLYGLVMIVGPTSLMLIFALSYLDVPYTTWLKYIWRFVLSLFIVIFAVLLILVLL